MNKFAATTYESPEYKLNQAIPGGVSLSRNTQTFSLNKAGGNGNNRYYYNIDDCVLDYGTYTQTIEDIDGVSYISSTETARVYITSELEVNGVALAMGGRIVLKSTPIVDSYGRYAPPIDSDGDPIIWYNSTWTKQSSVSGASNSRVYWFEEGFVDDNPTVTFDTNQVGGSYFLINEYELNGVTTKMTRSAIVEGIKVPVQVELRSAGVDSAIEDDTVKTPEELGICENSNDSLTVVGGAKLLVNSVVRAACTFVSSVFNGVSGRFHQLINVVDSVIGGSNNEIDNMTNSTVLGHGNFAVNSSCDTILGAANKLLNNGIVVTVDGRHRYNTICGAHNVSFRNKFLTILGGYNHAVECPVPTTLIGYGLKAANNTQYGMLISGKYNDTKAGMLEVVGNGTSDGVRKDMRTLSPEGVERCQGWFPMTTVTAAPSTAPSALGLWEYDSTNKCFYVAVGTSASTDWKKITLS